MRIDLLEQASKIMPDFAATYRPEVLNAANSFSAAVYRNSNLQELK